MRLVRYAMDEKVQFWMQGECIMIDIFKSGNVCSDRWLCQLNSSVMMKTTTTLLPCFSTASVSRLKSFLFGRPRASESSYTSGATLHAQRFSNKSSKPLYFTAQDRKLWVTHHFYIRFNLDKSKKYWGCRWQGFRFAYGDYARCTSGSQTPSRPTETTW